MRGRGIGQALLEANLAEWNELDVPTYLESTNPANDHRYERLGFRRVGRFTSVHDDAPITTMWRAATGAAHRAGIESPAIPASANRVGTSGGDDDPAEARAHRDWSP
jgi:hypothetical protein